MRYGRKIPDSNSPVGGYAWRKIHGLTTWRDAARHWRAQRFTPAGFRSPAPWVDCRLPSWRVRSE